MRTQYSTYRTLLAPISGHGISEAEAKDILRQILTHLSELHDCNQAHGSISLDTVAYDYDLMEIILLDANGTNHPTYLAPEVLQTQQATPTADIYALGVVIIVLLTGLSPEALKTSNNTWNWQELCNVSDQFIQILNTALSAELAFRYVNAGQMLRSLQPVINPAESTITSLANNYGTLLLPPTLLKQQSSLPATLSPESHSLETLTSDSNYSYKTKKLKVNFPGSKIYKKAKASKNLSKVTSKGIIRTLITILFGVGLPVSSAVGAYFYMQSQSANTAKNNVEFANSISQSMDKAVTHIYDERKSDDDIDKLIALAKDKYENKGSLTESKTMLQAIPLDSRKRAKADQLLAQWEKDIKKNNDLSQKVEQPTNNEKWQAAIDTVKVISLAPYWQQWRGKEIVEEPKQNLANPAVVTTSPSVSVPVTNVNPPHNSTTESYNPPTDNPPSEPYTPTSEGSTPPLPPAPRVAK